ncbi:MAG: tripartite tricarboxylate transporter substrate-binding protein [Thermodesulfobacteriota bacterium]
MSAITCGAGDGASRTLRIGGADPLLTPGIPGFPILALLMGAFIIHGLTPGPFLFQERPDVVWGLIASMYLGNVILLVLNLPLVGLWAKLLEIRYPFLYSGILLFCTVGDNDTQWKAGRIRMLTIMDTGRTKFYPDLPTTAEPGFPTILSASTRGIAAPRGVPGPIMKKLQDVFYKAMMTKEHMDMLEKAGQPVKIMPGEEFGKYYREQFKVAKKWVDYVRKK